MIEKKKKLTNILNLTIIYTKIKILTTKWTDNKPNIYLEINDIVKFANKRLIETKTKQTVHFVFLMDREEN